MAVRCLGRDVVSKPRCHGRVYVTIIHCIAGEHAPRLSKCLREGHDGCVCRLKGPSAARCGKASSTPRASPRPAELPEPDKRVPTPVIAAAELRAVARTAMASQVVVVVEGQRRVGIVSEMLSGCRLGVCMRVGAAF